MLAILYFLVFELCGMGIIYFLLPGKRLLIKGWLGMCLGLILMMWLPALCAFFLRFSLPAHWAALGLLALITGGSYLGRDKKRKAPKWDSRDKGLLKLLLLLALPLTLFTAYLHWTHTICPMPDGSLHVGQSTYGDLPLHLAIASGMRNAPFPPDYSILPGRLLTYPFLMDSLSSSFMLMGFSLRAALLFPGILMSALTFSGYVILAERLADTRKGAALAALFFFINGGLGFFYLFDMAGTAPGTPGHNELQSVAGLWERIKLVLGGWYQTPANHAEFTTYNLRWSNVIVDMMVPQRTTLGGWCQVLPCLYLLYDGLRPEREAALPQNALPVSRKNNWQQQILLGLWAGMLPMVNTHCFLGLGLCSAGWLLYDCIRNRKDWKNVLPFWAVYGCLAVAVAIPQLFTWTFHQAIGNQSFLQFQFNWVNGEQGMLDGYFWFYLKNIGLPFLLILLSLLEKNEKRRFIASGAFVIYVLAELIQFQPNPYDNNKLLYIWYMLCAVLAADYGLELLGRLKGLRARPVLAALCAFACFFSGTLALAREAVSDYEMFGSADVKAAAFVEENVPQDALFMTGTQHLNFVSSLAGRRIVCGPDTWLYWHGFSNWERHQDIASFYADPVGNRDILDKYGAKYILVSDYERSEMSIDLGGLESSYDRIYQSPESRILIYAVSGE